MWEFLPYAHKRGGFDPILFLDKNTFLLCHYRPILRILSLTRGLHDLRKWVFRDITERHTHTQTDRHDDSMTDPAQAAESVKILSIKKCINLKLDFVLLVFLKKRTKGL